jgi:hypothetical protein
MEHPARTHVYTLHPETGFVKQILKISAFQTENLSIFFIFSGTGPHRPRMSEV